MYQETFKNFMKLIRPFLKQQGFTSRGNNFHKRHPEGNIGVINFQKNPDGIPKFTINLGVYSLVLAEFFLEKFNEKKIKKYPSLGDYHWNTRVGSLVPKEHPARQKDDFWYKVGDKWWSYNDTTDVEELFQEISPLILTYGIPAIDKHLSDKQLIDEWLAIAERTKKRMEIEVGEHRAGTERVRMQILRDLAILLSAYGEKEKFKVMMSELHEYLQSRPELTGSKKDYDKLIRESTSEKRKVSTEEPSTSESKSRKH
jgi:Domain of unknown function (DUF4304)